MRLTHIMIKAAAILALAGMGLQTARAEVLGIVTKAGTGEKIQGMISLEMVGFTGSDQNYPPYIDRKYYPNVGDFIGIVGNERSRELLEQVYHSFRAHIPQLPTEFFLVPGSGEGMEEVALSDHRPFWDQGLPALLVTDTAFLRNPNYHLPSDTLKTLNFEFMEKVATGIYSSVVELTKPGTVRIPKRGR